MVNGARIRNIWWALLFEGSVAFAPLRIGEPACSGSLPPIWAPRYGTASNPQLGRPRPATGRPLAVLQSRPAHRPARPDRVDRPQRCRQDHIVQADRYPG